MLHSYLKIALRNLRKQKLYSFINLFGLALSMSVGLLIILLVMDQRSYDRFNPKANRIYRVIANRTSPDGDTRLLAATPAMLAPAIVRDAPAVEETTRLGQIRTNAIYNGKSLGVTGLFAEPSFFDVFGFKLLAGDP
ncbi:MAG TPA: ABC transporter permease, partial [Rhodothermales bacterium]|nr:ABC transporter permease [Rhodothermales bacterium]